MSIQWPEKRAVSDRKYHEAGVRGRFENNLRIVRGTIDTTTPTILEGVGFSVVKQLTGEVTVTFDPPFSQTLSAFGTVDQKNADAGFTVAVNRANVEPTTAILVRFTRWNQAGTNTDGVFHFIAIGPA